VNLFWGKDRVVIYNKLFATMAQSYYPAMMGTTARQALVVTVTVGITVLSGAKSAATSFNCAIQQ
jgi:hypothetical protein